MSPVSRNRKRKKTGAGTGRHRHSAAAAAWPEPRRAPAWFDASVTGVLDGAESLLAAQGPRELEDTTAKLLGAELYRALNEERQGLRFDRWFEDLVEAAVARIRVAAGNANAWVPPWRLLHGLTSIGPSSLSAAARTALGRSRKVLARDALRSQPEWLALLPRITATGEVWQMRDVYGARFGVIAGLSYPGGTDRSVFLFDVDACGLVELADAGAFDDVAQAAAAWRAGLGDTAGDAEPSPVETSEQLLCLVHCSVGESILKGTESRSVMDNWFRAPRRISDLARALPAHGLALPEARSLWHDVDIAPMAQAFTTWYRDEHGADPDPEGVDAVAAEWLEGSLPGTEHAASPHRARYLFTLLDDWIADHRVTIAAKTLLPEWVRWNGERAGLPTSLIDRAVAGAAGGPALAADRCDHGTE